MQQATYNAEQRNKVLDLVEHWVHTGRLHSPNQTNTTISKTVINHVIQVFEAAKQTFPYPQQQKSKAQELMQRQLKSFLFPSLNKKSKADLEHLIRQLQQDSRVRQLNLDETLLFLYWLRRFTSNHS